MDSAKNGKWIIPFKKFGMVRVNSRLQYITYAASVKSKLIDSQMNIYATHFYTFILLYSQKKIKFSKI